MNAEEADNTYDWWRFIYPNNVLAELKSELARKDEALGFVETLLRYPPIVSEGISSKAMLAYALGGVAPVPDWEYPRDREDLSRCEEVRLAAPAVLHERMDEVLALYRAALGEWDD